MLIRLKPGLAQVQRGPSSVQIGLDPTVGTVLEDLDAEDLALLDRLRRGVTPDRLTQGARPTPDQAADRAAGLLHVLDRAGLLQRRQTAARVRERLRRRRPHLEQDAQVWSLARPDGGDGWPLLVARSRCRVVVVGSGRLADALAEELLDAGVGRVDRERTGSAPGGVDLAVLVDAWAADHREAAAWQAADVPHLSVVRRECSVTVGPLVVPGRTPCLRCLDLWRSAQDPGWPRVLAQVLALSADAAAAPPPLREPSSPTPRNTPAEQVTLARTAAGLACLRVLDQLDGGPGRPGPATALEVALPHGRATPHSWPAHPECGCTWRPQELPQERPRERTQERRPEGPQERPHPHGVAPARAAPPGARMAR